MAQFEDSNSDAKDNANGTTILGWIVAPAMLLATLYISGMGPIIGSFTSGSSNANAEHAETAASVAQVFSVRYID
ncbi:hypothetical protein ACR9YC_05350 [Parasphingorhabdus sp. DH2-15]|uniref:hypothetical protein n=1 Tax=Parasphingorhabdus sp. DH2-15 TaxID=3444112 RepID=UPI003F6855EA